MTGATRSATRRRTDGKSAVARVRDAFRPDVLAELCALEDFDRYAPRTDLSPRRDGHRRFLHHRDNGSNVLAVAHLDSVQSDGTCTFVDTGAGPLALCPTLDDRLGVYVIVELLPRLGVTVDWLLTTDEEVGESTAAAFGTDKSYNWMFQFDRGGTDVVMYDYETPGLVGLVEASGARVGTGSFSDICMLEHLGCAGFNWGVGYRDYHGPRAHAWLEDTFTMVSRFLRFYVANHSTRFPHTPRPPLDPFDFPYPLGCEDCGEVLTFEGFCPACDDEWVSSRVLLASTGRGTGSHAVDRPSRVAP